ncbi:hypothetical protein FQN50_001653 [Emmonsiellopsis sp. PD_5]|nr:hypothetical protein FQN50_001653 [Emmonsiellopsis sp. PD_5]
MPKVTILGAGVSGLASASILSKFYDVTIIARDLPGDDWSYGWASPWAGAVFLGLDGSTPREQQMQRDSFAFLWNLAKTHPESSIRRIEMHDFQDVSPLEQIWYRDLMPEFRVMAPEDCPEGVKLGMSYQTVVLNPGVFLPWLRKLLEARGVKFQRRTVNALSDLKGEGHDVLINATACGSKFLTDVADQEMQLVRGQTVLVKTAAKRITMRHGKDYTYVIPRLDGTAVLGGIKQIDNLDQSVDVDLKNDIIRRVHENAPDTFIGNDPANIEIIRDNVGFRPARVSGLRVEKEVLDGQKIVHAYGTSGGGYVFSFGLAKAVAELVDDFVYTPPLAKM